MTGLGLRGEDLRLRWQSLVGRWQSVCDIWDDRVRREFEEHHWRELEAAVLAVQDKLEALSDLVADALRSD